ncbi:SPOR domain-containing protein [Jannaschia helgolandensis]|uniref:Sporulation related domain-containing protein n=1 Tax=Jannaschia helgolandensis TaxID=188906 RepID=A0A1H7NNV6_9RHOB|nr:Sporulation related domain-containing protein [Jannaschia helgolandensis]
MTVRQAFHGALASRTIRFTSSVALIALIAGCQSALNGGSDATRAAPAFDSVQLIERDVEAPEVFKAQDRALWDGRPSLGGVWVAAPGVRDPERVIIRNSDNGKFVIGALFKRERDNPGPALQLSSDAAAALGIIAGAPTIIDVVALRREEVSEPVAAPAASAPLTETETVPLTEETVQTAVVPATPHPDAIAAAATAIDTDEPDTMAVIGSEGAEVSVAASVEQPARRRNVFQRLFGRKTPASTPLSAAPSDPSTTALSDAGPAASSAISPTVTATSLDAPPVRTASAAPAPARSTGLDRAYVQIGIFSVEENARNTATSLSTAGVVPTVLEQESQGRRFWRVVVGPSTTASDRAAVIRKAKGLGFTDAFAVGG